MEQNLKDIKVKIEKIEQNFEDIRSNVEVEKNFNTIINSITNIEKSLSIKNENKDTINNTHESLEKRISALEKYTAMLSEEFKKKATTMNTPALKDEPVPSKTVNNIDIKLELKNLDTKIKIINNRIERIEKIEINTEKIIAILERKYPELKMEEKQIDKKIREEIAFKYRPPAP